MSKLYNIDIELPNPIIHIFKKISEQNGQAYIVGGAVRDKLLGREVNEYDIVTDLPAVLIQKLFSTARVIYPPIYSIYGFQKSGYHIEIARMREDYNYTGRHSQIHFTKDIHLDLLRRDFTVNALAYDFNTGRIIDNHEGIVHLKEHRIVTIGDPFIKFDEDRLRMIRAINFAVKLNFKLDDAIINTIRKYSEKINDISKEQLRVEWNKILKYKNTSRALFLFHITGIYKKIFSTELDKSSFKSVARSLDNLHKSSSPPYLKMVSMLYLLDLDVHKIRIDITKREKKLLSQCKKYFPVVKKFLDGSDEFDIVDLIDSNFRENILNIFDSIDPIIFQKLKQRIPRFDIPPLLRGYEIDIQSNLKSKVLKEIRYFQLIGKIDSKEEARKILEKYSTR